MVFVLDFLEQSTNLGAAGPVALCLRKMSNVLGMLGLRLGLFDDSVIHQCSALRAVLAISSLNLSEICQLIR